jgi:predicted dehydrogenase
MLRRYPKRTGVLHRIRASLLRARAVPRQEGDPTPLRYALIGAGAAARSHLAGIAHQPGVNLVGIADPTDPKRWRISGDYAATVRFADAKALFEALKPDLVSICTPTRFHCELTLLALRAGAHVVCEKPMAMTVSEAEDMDAACRAAGKLGAVNFSYRNAVAFRYGRGLIRNGKLGQLKRVSVAYLQSFLGLSTARWSWRNDAAIAGFGALGDLGVHMIDAVRFLTGREFVGVVARAQTLIPDRRDDTGKPRRVTTDTNAAFLAELTGGLLAIFEASQVATAYGDFFRIEVSGEHGTLVLNGEQPDWIGLSASRAHSMRTDIRWRKVPAGVAQQVAPTSPGAIVHALRGVEVSYPNFTDGVAAQRVLGGLLDSMSSGGWVSLT